MTEAAPLSGPGVEALVRRVIDVINGTPNASFYVGDGQQG